MINGHIVNLTQFLVAFTSDSSYCIWKTKEVTLADTKGCMFPLLTYVTLMTYVTLCKCSMKFGV